MNNVTLRSQVFSRDGSFLREYRIPDLKASTLAIGEGDQIVIADSANRCVHVVNMETGKCVQVISIYQSFEYRIN